MKIQNHKGTPRDNSASTQQNRLIMVVGDAIKHMHQKTVEWDQKKIMTRSDKTFDQPLTF